MGLSFTYYPETPTVDQETLNNKSISFRKTINDPKTQFFKTIENTDLITSTIKAYNHFGAKKHFIHVGIGGSSLGPELLVSALKKNNTQFTFINNIDPDEIYDQLRPLINANLNDCLFYFVSKSGGTAETLAALAIITQFLSLKNVKPEDYKNYFIFATDQSKSELLDIAKTYDIKTLEVPSAVGGRFSALTPVGYLPALYAGLNIDQLLQGAKDAQRMILNDQEANDLYKCADFLYTLKNECGINQTVMMPYSSKLRNFSFWFSQLWGESLGKKLNLKGEVVSTGLTPLASYGATDQHSIVQLFMEGPNDKAFILIEVENFTHDYSLSSPISSPNLNKLSEFSLGDLIKAELEGTIKALDENQRNVIHLKISKNDEYHMAYMIMFFEALTVVMGDYLEIDPFNQPGVELGKIYAFEYLNRL